jgi:hypothetical protein
LLLQVLLLQKLEGTATAYALYASKGRLTRRDGSAQAARRFAVTDRYQSAATRAEIPVPILRNILSPFHGEQA